MENSSFGGYSNDFWAAKAVQLLIGVGALWSVIRLEEAVTDPAQTGSNLFLYVLAFIVAAIGIISVGYFILDWAKEKVDPLDAPRLKRATRSTRDNLTKIEGVGPKIAELLSEGGYKSFQDIADASQSDLKSILDDAGTRFRMHDTKSWPRQAQLAADGDWDELQKLQDRLDGGK